MGWESLPPKEAEGPSHLQEASFDSHLFVFPITDWENNRQPTGSDSRKTRQPGTARTPTRCQSFEEAQ